MEGKKAKRKKEKLRLCFFLAKLPINQVTSVTSFSKLVNQKENSMFTDETYAKEVVDAAIEVHRTLGGPGLLEKTYQKSLAQELWLRKIPCKIEVPVSVTYKGTQINEPFYLDIIVGDALIIEVKATEKYHAVHRAQLLTYLRLSGVRLGLLINFGQELVKDGISRVVNQNILSSLS